jgi:LAO/AO transport system kinase
VPDPAALAGSALKGDKDAVSRLVSLFEDRRPQATSARAEALAALAAAAPDRRPATVIGFTGTPGSGKSSLLARLTEDLLERDGDLRVAVLAVDPSSHVSGGALLGDRTRIRVTTPQARLFFRSQASETDLGGLSPASFSVCRLLTKLFDLVFVETVGIGQSEADIRHLADRVYLVLAPLGGDEVQYLKAGIIEVPHAFILNKCDDPSATRAFHQLRSSLWLARPFDDHALGLYKTSAKTGEGVPELAGALLDFARSGSGGGIETREPYFFGRWVTDEWGRTGRRLLDGDLGGAEAFLDAAGGFEPAQEDFGARFRSWVADGGQAPR